jgi:hypothetical protein
MYALDMFYLNNLYLQITPFRMVVYTQGQSMTIEHEPMMKHTRYSYIPGMYPIKEKVTYFKL